MSKQRCKNRIETALQFLYPTSDDWLPCFPRSTVQFTVYCYHGSLRIKRPATNGMIRIVARGQDDRAMEKDIFLNQSDYAVELQKIQKWCDSIPNPVTMDWLKTQGFSFV